MRLGPAKPRCFSERDAELWWAADRVAWKIGGRPKTHIVSPCDDCNRDFAESMRAVGLCNGLYPGEESEAMPVGSQRYASDEERLAARRATWRRAGRRRRDLRAAP